jgi:hypothetical protein
MRAFQKFDPAAYRSTRYPPLPHAKHAKAAKSARHLSSFSKFSRAPASGCDSWTPADWHAYFEERAAIREYDGGLSRSDAEHVAFDDAVAQWLSAHPIPASPPERCVQCGGGHRTYDELLPVLASGGHVWVHNKCWTDWYVARRQEAATALKGIGLGALRGREAEGAHDNTKEQNGSS